MPPRPPEDLSSPDAERAHLPFSVLPQPDDTTCGPTCLHAVYRYWGDETSLSGIIQEVAPLPGGGTLAVWLALHALARGYTAKIYTYNLQLFDPSWFADKADVKTCLEEQARIKSEGRLHQATAPYLDFLDQGGQVLWGDRPSKLIRRYLKRGIPILTGLSATYLYGCAREHNDDYDAIRGEPTGHFVVLSGYEPTTRQITVADPTRDNPRFKGQYYSVDVERLVSAIMLGIVTYDANLLVLEPRKSTKKEG